MKVTLHQSISDELLIQASKAGKIEAQKSLFDRYAPRMLALCKRYVKDRDEAEDIMITGFAKAFERLGQFREEGSFEGWLRRLMVNESLGYLRKTKNLQLQVSINDEEVQIEDSTIGDHLEASELMMMIESLPDGYRTVFNLYAIEGYSHKEIAEQLGINENTSKSQLSRARDFLKRKINQMQNKELSVRKYE
jgi:RNA polymerase sigma factor (sigma-70 family)